MGGVKMKNFEKALIIKNLELFLEQLAEKQYSSKSVLLTVLKELLEEHDCDYFYILQNEPFEELLDEYGFVENYWDEIKSLQEE